jgi:hypothetical protein
MNTDNECLKRWCDLFFETEACSCKQLGIGFTIQAPVWVSPFDEKFNVLFCDYRLPQTKFPAWHLPNLSGVYVRQPRQNQSFFGPRKISCYSDKKGILFFNFD